LQGKYVFWSLYAIYNFNMPRIRLRSPTRHMKFIIQLFCLVYCGLFYLRVPYLILMWHFINSIDKFDFTFSIAVYSYMESCKVYCFWVCLLNIRSKWLILSRYKYKCLNFRDAKDVTMYFQLLKMLYKIICMWKWNIY